MSKQKITIARCQRYACIQCGRCCRRWRVALSKQDATRLRELRWDNHSDIPADPVTSINGHPFVAHKPTGDCVYLDPATNLCRIHARHGAEAKPLGCRVYPLNIASTYWGELSVTARMDCLAVQRNEGPPLISNRKVIERYAAQLDVRGGYSDELGELSPTTVEFICRTLCECFLQRADLDPGRRNRAMLLAVERLEQLGVDFLNDIPTMQEVLPSFAQRVIDKALDKPGRYVGSFSRGVFRQWLGSYLRRDEEVVGKLFPARVRRCAELAKLLFGYGSFGKLGSEHPAVPVRAVPMFPLSGNGDGQTAEIASANQTSRPPRSSPVSSEVGGQPLVDAVEANIWTSYERMLQSRLETLQFFGVTYYGAMFFDGLRALVQTYPLVLAAARCRAASRNAGQIDCEDVQYAVGAVDHSFGRSRLLQMQVWRALEKYFSGPRYGRLLNTMGWY